MRRLKYATWKWFRFARSDALLSDYFTRSRNKREYNQCLRNDAGGSQGLEGCWSDSKPYGWYWVNTVKVLGENSLLNCVTGTATSERNASFHLAGCVITASRYDRCIARRDVSFKHVAPLLFSSIPAFRVNRSPFATPSIHHWPILRRCANEISTYRNHRNETSPWNDFSIISSRYRNKRHRVQWYRGRWIISIVNSGLTRVLAMRAKKRWGGWKKVEKEKEREKENEFIAAEITNYIRDSGTFPFRLRLSVDFSTNEGKLNIYRSYVHRLIYGRASGVALFRW